MKPALSRDVEAAIVEALGAPLEGCQSATVDLVEGSFATATLTYTISAEVLWKAANRLLAERSPK